MNPADDGPTYYDPATAAEVQDVHLPEVAEDDACTQDCYTTGVCAHLRETRPLMPPPPARPTYVADPWEEAPARKYALDQITERRCG